MQEFYSLLRSTSRTFAVGIEALPRELRDAVTMAYLVLRVSDYYEDSPSLEAEEKVVCLHRWADLLGRSAPSLHPTDFEPLTRALAAADRALPDHQAAQAAHSIQMGLSRLPERYRSAIRSHTVATTLGMAEWVTRGDDFPDEEALDRYMFEVAGRVGVLLTELFAAYSPRVRKRAESLHEVAVSFGLGLQTVNVIRGLHEDPDRGWTYVPRHLLHRLPERGHLRDLPSEDQQRILDFLVAKAGRHVADAIRYCQLLPRGERGIRTFCIVPALLASRTARLSHQDPGVFEHPVRVTRREVERTVLSARLLGWSNRWLEQERRRALSLTSLQH